MTDKPTGVFVRLPLDADQRDIVLEIAGRDCLTAALLAIGTPVTGGELEVVGYAHCVNERIVTIGQYQNPDVLKKTLITSEALIRQSAALAKLAEKDAEVARKDAEIARKDEEISSLVAALSEIHKMKVAVGFKDNETSLDMRYLALEALRGQSAV